MSYQDNHLIDEDGEVRELTEADFARMKPIAEVLPPNVVNMLLTHQAEMIEKGLMKPRGRGKQKAPTKRSVTIRLSEEVINAFKATGKGWQTRIDEALLQYVRNLG